MENTIELMVLVHRTMMRCILCDILRYVPVRDYVIQKFKLHFKIKIRSRWTRWF